MMPSEERDLADVQELIRVRGLESTFADRLDASVRETFLELHQELEQAREQRLGPGSEREPEG